MILDRGICTVYARRDISDPGDMPRYETETRTQSYYGELSFETTPQWTTEHREETRTDARVRILQCRRITHGDTAALLSFADGQTRTYRITRAYHGTDEESGEAITDLSLQEVSA